MVCARTDAPPTLAGSGGGRARRRRGRSALLRGALALLFLLPASACTTGGEPNATALRFSLHDADSSEALPDDVVRGLGTDERVLDCFTDPQTGIVAFDRNWFVVRRVDLDGDGLPDWVLSSRQECLRDDRAGLWWLYHERGEGRHLLLRTPAHSIGLSEPDTPGFRDVHAHGAEEGRAPVRFGYDGESYVRRPPPP